MSNEVNLFSKKQNESYDLGGFVPPGGFYLPSLCPRRLQTPASFRPLVAINSSHATALTRRYIHAYVRRMLLIVDLTIIGNE